MEDKIFTSKKWWELLEGIRFYISNELGHRYKGSFNEDKDCRCGGAKTWALTLGLSPTFYQQYVRGE